VIVDFEETPLFLALQDTIKGLGFEIVEVSSRVKDTRAQVHLVIYRAEGVDHQGCAMVGRGVTTTLEDFFESRDVHLEVSSPGLERQIKTWREFAVFSGLPAKIFRRGGDWESVTIGQDLVKTDIIKARLDRLGEGILND